MVFLNFLISLGFSFLSQVLCFIQPNIYLLCSRNIQGLREEKWDSFPRGTCCQIILSACIFVSARSYKAKIIIIFSLRHVSYSIWRLCLVTQPFPNIMSFFLGTLIRELLSHLCTGQLPFLSSQSIALILLELQFWELPTHSASPFRFRPNCFLSVWAQTAKTTFP